MTGKKKVPEIRFKGFSGEWKEKKLGETVLIQRGGSPRPIEDFITDRADGINWIKIGDVEIESRYITSTKEKIIPAGEKKSRRVFVGDLILSNSMSFGRPYIMKIEGCIHDGWLLIRDEKRIFDIEYLQQLLASNYMLRQYKALAAGGVVINLNSNLVQSTNVWIPNILEQSKIGDFFQNLDSLITLQQRKYEKLTKVKKSMLEKMFPKDGADVPEIRFKGFTSKWVKRELGIDIAEIIGGGTPSTSNPEYWNGDIDWYSPTEIGDKVYAEGSIKRITELGLVKSSATLLPAKKTILFTSRAGIGDLAILNRSGTTNQGFQSLVLNEGYNTYFIYSMGHLIKRFALKYSSGSTFLEISGKTLGQMKIKIPELNEQIKIGNFFQQLDSLITLQQQELDKLKNIKKACLEKMFV